MARRLQNRQGTGAVARDVRLSVRQGIRTKAAIVEMHCSFAFIGDGLVDIHCNYYDAARLVGSLSNPNGAKVSCSFVTASVWLGLDNPRRHQANAHTSFACQGELELYQSLYSSDLFSCVVRAVPSIESVLERSGTSKRCSSTGYHTDNRGFRCIRLLDILRHSERASTVSHLCANAYSCPTFRFGLPVAQP